MDKYILTSRCAITGELQTEALCEEHLAQVAPYDPSDVKPTDHRTLCEACLATTDVPELGDRPVTDLTIRQLFSAIVYSGLHGNHQLNRIKGDRLSRMAIRFTDELLKELETPDDDEEA